ncbi:MAG: 23S rRNA (guanosine(2251)-2'-O)-methyltransferase RlmB [Elusimicrobia bacterium]|nr:23S rRNA (guanosine(2251)-2'-O)-methyltransferase RlmB [Elusimicrobiota bacterium]
MIHRYCGKQSVREVLSSDLTVRKVLLDQGAEKNSLQTFQVICREKRVPCQWVSSHVLDTLVRENHQGVVAEVESAGEIDFKTLCSSLPSDFKGSLCLLDEIQDPQNLGAIIRSAVCFGCHAVVLPKWRSAGVTETVMRSSSGALAHLTVAHVSNLNVAIERLREKGFCIVGADADSPVTIPAAQWTYPVALLLGNEHRGIKPVLKKNCDVLVSIPQSQRLSSLNVASAATIFFYEIYRRVS